jgi:hypothetical protein
MNVTIRKASILALVALLVPLAQASAGETPVPNINKRGEDEKKFVEKLTNAIVTAGRTTVKSATVKKFEKKEPKPGHTEYHITAGYKGRVSGSSYTATIVVHIDSSTKDKWEVTRIEFDDDNKLPKNRKNIDKMVDKLNGK